MSGAGKYFSLTLIATAALVIFYYVTTTAPAPSSLLAQPVMLVEVVPVLKQTIVEKLEAVGSVRAYESVTISANVTEYVKKLYFEDGDSVKKGNLLVELETTEERTQLAEAKVRLHEAQLHFERIQNLLKNNFSAQSEYDAQKANVDSAKARVEQIEATIADRNITAPFDGILGFRLISEGALIGPGDDIVTLDMLQPLRVDFSLPEKYLSSLREDQPFTATSVAYPNQVFNGKIAIVNTRVDEGTRAVTLRGLINNKELKLKPGMLLHITLPISQKEVWTIPEQALLAQENKRYIFIISAGKSKAFRREVTIIMREGENIHIEGDLREEDQVVVKGGFKLQDGQEVIINHVAQ